MASHYWSIDCDKMNVRVGRTGSTLGSNTTFQMLYKNGSMFEFTEISKGLTLATANSRNIASSDIVEHWLVDPYHGTYDMDTLDSAPLQWVDLSKVPTAVFNQRLEMAINTYWDVTLGVTLRKGNITRDRAGDFELYSETDPSLSYTWNTTSIHNVQHAGQQYVCHVWFAIITITISLFLVAAALALVLGILTKAPETLGYVSTSARDNPYVTTQVASHLDGLEAARVLRNVRIRIGDVNMKAEVGHVAFASMDTGPGKVSRKRQYD